MRAVAGCVLVATATAVGGSALGGDGHALGRRQAGSAGNYEIYAMNVASGRRTNLSRSPLHDYGPAWSPKGARIAFLRLRPSGQRELWIMRADGRRKRKLVADVTSDPTWSPNGRRLAYTAYVGSFQDSLYVVDVAGGSPRRLTERPSALPSWSPKGGWIAFNVTGEAKYGYGDVAVTRPNGTGFRSLAKGYLRSRPLWSPDGTRIAFARAAGALGTPEVYVVDVRTGREQQVTSSPPTPLSADLLSLEWSPVGNRLLLVRWSRRTRDRSGDATIVTIGRAGARTVLRDIRRASWSPDGRRIAFARAHRQAGVVTALEIGIVRLGRRPIVRRVSPGPGEVAGPLWSPDGKRLLYALLFRPKAGVATAASALASRAEPRGDPGSDLPSPRQHRLGLAVDTHAGDLHLSRVKAVERGEQVQESRFPGPPPPYDLTTPRARATSG